MGYRKIKLDCASVCSDARSRGKPRHRANLLIMLIMLILRDKNSVLILCIILVAVSFGQGSTTLNKKKEPSQRFAARSTLFNLVISCFITSAQRRARSSATVRADHAWSSMTSDDGTAFFSPWISGMVLFLARVVVPIVPNRVSPHCLLIGVIFVLSALSNARL